MIISKTPFRISFVGGGTDFKEFYEKEPGAVISTAINKYMYVTVNKRFEKGFRVSYSLTEIVNNLEDIQHELVREACRLVGIKGGLELTTISNNVFKTDKRKTTRQPSIILYRYHKRC